MSQADLSEELFRHVDCLAGLIGPRHLEKPKTIEATIGYITKALTSIGFTVSQEHYEALGHSATNLIAELPGTSRGDEIVVVGAHYDTVDTTPGADDNASAIAVLIEVARALHAQFSEQLPRRTLRLVAFACEEPPYFNFGAMGSQNHARISRERGDKIVGMLCLEMLGYFSDEPNSQTIPDAIPKPLRWVFPKRANFLVAVGNLHSKRLCWNFRRGFRRGTKKLPLFAICLPEIIKEIQLSDNRAFWEQGYPALMITDTSFLRNPNYHRPSDTPDTLDYARMALAVLGVASATGKLLR